MSAKRQFLNLRVIPNEVRLFIHHDDMLSPNHIEPKVDGDDGFSRDGAVRVLLSNHIEPKVDGDPGCSNPCPDLVLYLVLADLLDPLKDPKLFL